VNKMILTLINQQSKLWWPCKQLMVLSRKFKRFATNSTLVAELKLKKLTISQEKILN